MTALLTIRADEILWHDALTEGSYVALIEFEPRTDEQGRSVSVKSCKAAVIPVEGAAPGHLHDLSHETVEIRRFKRSDTVRVIRPAPLEPCTFCGFPETAKNEKS